MPPAVMGAVMLGTSLLGQRKGGAEKAQEGIARQQAALASEMQGFARDQHTMAAPALNKAMQYYMTLANGNRGAMDAALAPERGQLMDTYTGAEKGMNARMAPGPQRDRALADLTRQKAGQLGMMPFQARQGAMGALGDMGKMRLEAAMRGYGGAGSAMSGASNTNSNLMEAEQQRNQQWKGIGESAANIFLPYLTNMGGGKSPLPSTPFNPGKWGQSSNFRSPTRGEWGYGQRIPGVMF